MDFSTAIREAKFWLDQAQAGNYGVAGRRDALGRARKYIAAVRRIPRESIYEWNEVVREWNLEWASVRYAG